MTKPSDESDQDPDRKRREVESGFLDAEAPEEIAAEYLANILVDARVDPHSGELVVTLTESSESGDDEVQEAFSSLADLKAFLSDLRYEHAARYGTLFVVPFPNDDRPSIGVELVDAALEESGLAQIYSASKVAPPIQIFSVDDHPPSPLMLPAVGTDIILVNRELISFLAKNPKALFTLGPRQFEEIVAELFRDFGYETILTPQTRDGGRDILAVHKDSIGTLLFLIECKRYAPDHPVGVAVVDRLYGVTLRERASHGVIATTSRFTEPAIRRAHDVRYQLSLRDYDDLVGWLRSYRGMDARRF
jgi:HJR/Mrr/RecB family endonuclease